MTARLRYFPIFLILAVVPSLLHAREVCEFNFTVCPESYNGDTIVLPENAVALSADVFSCTPSAVIEGAVGSQLPPSIVFIIDHSGSMTGTGYAERDRWGARYTIFKDMLDTLSRVQPSAEVSIVIFREFLFLDKSTTQYFTQYLSRLPRTLDNQPDQAYLPFLKLNQDYGGRTGKQIILDVLDTAIAVTQRNGQSYSYVDLTYQPNFSTIGNTNINVAFDAARDALADAKNPPNRQFVIFFSDGEPKGPYFAEKPSPFYFSEGQGLPTTFTVFFTDSTDSTGKPLATPTGPPQSLLTMTENIQRNGYSANNIRSGIWTITQINREALLSLLLNKIFKIVLIYSEGTPQKMILNGQSSTTRTDSTFRFAQRFPLQPDLTQFILTINYKWVNQTTGILSDSTVNADIYVKRVAGAPVPEGIAFKCWEQPTLQLLYNDSVVSRVFEYMDQLEVGFSQGGEAPSSVKVSVGSSIDRDTLTLTRQGSTPEWTYTFPRFIETKGVAGDKKLQHQAVDSIVVVWRNPTLPLDTIRIAVPFSISRAITLDAAFYHDRNADGLVDSIFVAVTGTLSGDDVTGIMNWITLPTGRSLTVERYAPVQGGFAIIVKSAVAVRTDVSADDVLRIEAGILPGGGWVVGGDVRIQDRMAPVISIARLVAGSAGAPDSLAITFSEKIREVNYNQPFRFQSVAGVAYVAVLDYVRASDATVWFTVVSLTPVTVNEVNQGDSVWIYAQAQVRDSLANDQNNPNNRRVQITVKSEPFELIPQTANNPYSPGSPSSWWPTRLLTSVGIKETNGVILMAVPKTELRGNVTLSGTVSIYDVVKNTVIKDQPMAFDRTGKRLLFVWNTYNLNGRPVATGTYSAMLDMTDHEGYSARKTVFVGVKR